MTEVDEQKPVEERVKSVPKSEIDSIAEIQAVMVNRAYATPFGPFIRITLGEFIPEAANVKMRASFALSLDDAAGLVGLLNQAVQASLNIIEEREKKLLEQKQKMEQNKKEMIKLQEDKAQEEFMKQLKN